MSICLVVGLLVLFVYCPPLLEVSVVDCVAVSSFFLRLFPSSFGVCYRGRCLFRALAGVFMCLCEGAFVCVSVCLSVCVLALFAR